MNGIPAVCDSCGFVFPSPFALTGTRNSQVVNCGTNCPRCNGNARVVDSYTDSSGELRFGKIINQLKTITDVEKLNTFKSQMAANEDQLTAAGLSEALTDLDPSFSNFSSLVSSIPPSAIKYFINLLLAIITLVIAYQTWQSADENHDESLELQRDQLSLAREEFEYNKKQDQNETASGKIHLDEKIDNLRSEFENKLNDIQKANINTDKVQLSRRPLKGNARNKPCPCGSGIKAKKCHRNGCI
jgi:hypothetical protein